MAGGYGKTRLGEPGYKDGGSRDRRSRRSRDGWPGVTERPARRAGLQGGCSQDRRSRRLRYGWPGAGSPRPESPPPPRKPSRPIVKPSRWRRNCCVVNVGLDPPPASAHQHTGWANWLKFLPASDRRTRKCSCSSAAPAIWRSASCGRACSISSAPASSRPAGSSASRSTRSTSTAFASVVRGALDKFAPRKTDDADWAAFAAIARLCRPRRRAPTRCKAAVDKAERGARRRKPAPALSQRAAQRGAFGGPAARRGRPDRTLARHHGKAVRHRSRQRQVAERASCTRSSPRTRFSASTISSARSRRRTSSRSASPTACSSRSGTAISSTTCRSTCPRRWASASAPASTSRPAPIATWW